MLFRSIFLSSSEIAPNIANIHLASKELVFQKVLSKNLSVCASGISLPQWQVDSIYLIDAIVKVLFRGNVVHL